jgi:hypothetical protein
LLAHHFTPAGMTEAAIEWWRTAEQRSLARYALLEGAAQFKRALDQIATLPLHAPTRTHSTGQGVLPDFEKVKEAVSGQNFSNGVRFFLQLLRRAAT